MAEYGKGLKTEKSGTVRTHADLEAERAAEDKDAYIEALEYHVAEHRRIVQRMNIQRIWVVAKLRLLQKHLHELVDAMGGRP